MSYEDIHVNQLDSFMQQPGAILIDIRDIHSYNAGHIKDALHIDGPTMSNLIRQRKKNPPIMIYCYHGNSSRDIASMVAGMGFSKVSHLVGGWDAWINYQIKADKSIPYDDDELFGVFA